MLFYIHIPFCDSKCGYCAFRSFDDKIAFKNAYLAALREDIRVSLEGVKSLSSIYIGGGTPNVLKACDYEEIFKILQPYINANAEITMELNPNNVRKDYLQDFINLGINRFSIGVQSFEADKLTLLQRRHDPKKAIKFIENAVSLGVKISIDLIYDTSLDTKASLENELEISSKLGVGHISCYSLSIDKDSKFYKNNYAPLSKNSLCYELKAKLESLGFSQYEVSNFAKNHKSTHNLGYWAYSEYIGVGLSAVGRLGDKRFYKSRDLGDYIANPHFREIENLSDDEMKMERIFLGLRSEIGVSVGDIRDKERLNLALESKKCVKKNGRIFATNYFIADELALWLG